MNSRIALIAAAFLGFALIAVIVRLVMTPSRSNLSFDPLPENVATTTPTSTTTPTTTVNENNASSSIELQAIDIKAGTGAVAAAGQEVTVHYVGTLDDGTKFDSSRDRGTPFTFNLGAGEVIKGWDLGVAGMKVGGVRKLVIPSQLAYGDRAIGTIPANSTLHFEVELLGVK